MNETEDIKMVLPPEESVVTVTLRWEPPDVPGGSITIYIIVLRVLGEANSVDEGSRGKRRTESFVDNCIVPNTTDNNFKVDANVTALDVNASEKQCLILN